MQSDVLVHQNHIHIYDYSKSRTMLKIKHQASQVNEYKKLHLEGKLVEIQTQMYEGLTRKNGIILSLTMSSIQENLGLCGPAFMRLS